MNIILLGGPGAGKGTLAKQLRKKYNYFLLAPGELYRKEAELKTEFGLKAESYWGDGNLCPDEMTNELVKKTINGLFKSTAFIFDGYPRTDVQAKYLDNICQIDLVLDLLVDDDIITKRLLKRKEIENRSDDTEEIIKQRLKVYHNNNEPIVDYYHTSHRYIGLDSSGTILETFYSAQNIILGLIELKKEQNHENS